MSERLHHSPEHKGKHIDASAESSKNLERLREAAKHAEKDPLQKHVESLQRSAEAHAISGKEHNAGDKHGENKSQAHHGNQKELKAEAYRKTIQRAQSQLSTPERVLSKIIHKPAVERASVIAEKTVARSSGFFFGSLFALLGSALLIYMTKYYGFTYNYAMFVVFFAGGFGLGLLIELIYKTVFRRAR